MHLGDTAAAHASKLQNIGSNRMNSPRVPSVTAREDCHQSIVYPRRNVFARQWLVVAAKVRRRRPHDPFPQERPHLARCRHQRQRYGPVMTGAKTIMSHERNRTGQTHKHERAFLHCDRSRLRRIPPSMPIFDRFFAPFLESSQRDAETHASCLELDSLHAHLRNGAKSNPCHISRFHKLHLLDGRESLVRKDLNLLRL